MLSGRWDVAAVGTGQTLIGVDMVAGSREKYCECGEKEKIPFDGKSSTLVRGGCQVLSRDDCVFRGV
eukprot:scaffold70262_cov88-Cyclotella_meneghiniana.AAC.2